MGDAADALTDSMIDAIAMGGYCPECDTIHDPEGPCECDEESTGALRQRSQQMNPVKQLLTSLTTECDDIRIYFKGTTHKFGADDCPPSAAMAFVREQLKALQEKLKETSA